MIKATDFIHPEDAAALKQLESIPGFPVFVKKVMAMGLEQLQYGINMASAIRLSPSQLPEIYNILPPICKKMGIDEPEFYLQMDPRPNAWTSGDTKIFITVTSGLVEMMSEDELIAVVAHECGHILCHHVLYHTIAQYILSGANDLGLLGTLTVPIQYALLYWERKSELSCDRASCIITDAQTVTTVMARLSGGPMSITKNINLEEWAKQADRYEEIRNGGLWNKALQVYAIAAMDHPFSAVRVREIMNWCDNEQYKRIKAQVERESTATHCSVCGSLVYNDWIFCKECGHQL